MSVESVKYLVVTKNVLRTPKPASIWANVSALRNASLASTSCERHSPMRLPSGTVWTKRKGCTLSSYRPRSSRRNTSPDGSNQLIQRRAASKLDRKSTRLNSSHLVISYAVFCLKKKKKHHISHSVDIDDHSI